MRYSRPRLIAAAVLGLTGSLLLAGCSSGSPNPTNAAGAPASTTSSPSTRPTGGAHVTEACSLVSEADVTAALGVDPGPGVAVPEAGLSECQFGDAPKFAMVDLGTGDAKATFDQRRANPPAGATPVDLTGIGDAAFGLFVNPAANIGFYRGSSFVSITIYDDGDQGRAVTLAKAAAGRL